MAAAVLPIGAQCPGCAGGGEVNGTECRDCGGRGRVVPARRRWRLPSLLGVADRLAVPVGTAVRWSMSLPGLLGAAGLSYSAAAVVHGLVRQVPEVPAAVLVASVFALALDRRL